jgi:uncharacterized iron-regulated protein
MLLLLLALAAQHPDTTPPEIWAPHRVYDSRHKRYSDFATLAAEAARSDVVFFGEQHDDPATHRMELALLREVARRRSDVVVSLEMFERDVQPILSQYLAGTISEAAFLKGSRPWPAYQTDYRPLIEFAKAHGWPVIAANVPRPMVGMGGVAGKGLGSITQRTDSTRAWAAAEFQCPKDDYFKRFGVSMGSHPLGDGPPPSAAELSAITERFYEAQCVKDETMAESIARAHRDATAPLVIQYNGDFHSDFGEGTAERTKRRLPSARIMIISAIPVATFDSIDAKPIRKQGDWLLFVVK